MKESDKDTYSETYPSVKEHNIYILKEGTKEYKQEELMEYFTGVGYTLEDMIADIQENGYEVEVNDPYFIIPLHYQLDGENLLAWVVPNEIHCTEYRKLNGQICVILWLLIGKKID